MKKACMIMATIFLILAIVFLAMSLTAGWEKPLVSQMSNWEIDCFMSRYGLEDLEFAKAYDLIRNFARQFEEMGVIINQYGYTGYQELITDLTAALRKYYGVGLPLFGV